MTSGSVLNQAKSYTKGYLASLVGISVGQATQKVKQELNMQVQVFLRGASYSMEARASILLFQEDDIVVDARAGDPSRLTD